MSSQPNPQILFSRQEIETVVTRLAAEIRRDYQGKNPLLIGILKGSFMFMADIAHDSHNIVAVGTNNEDIFTAIKEIERLQGGLVATTGGKVLASLALPITGLLSDEPLEVVIEKLNKLEQVAAHLGTEIPSPFSTLSFLALPGNP